MTDSGALADGAAALAGGGLVSPAADTILKITGMGVPPYSARGLQQTLVPIDQVAKQVRRTVNGTLRDLSAIQMRKYASAITCTDQQAPAFASLWPGMNVTVECVAELVCMSTTSLERPAVDGSIVNFDNYTIYRPRLEMRVIAFTETQDEYGRTVQWELDLEEI